MTHIFASHILTFILEKKNIRFRTQEKFIWKFLIRKRDYRRNQISNH